MYELACKCAVAIGYIDVFQFLSNQVITHAISFEDTLEIQLLTVSVLAFSSQIVHALERGLAVLTKLGEDLPNPTEDSLNHQIQRTNEMISGISDEEFHNYRIMTNPTKLVAMKILERLQIISYMINSPLHPFIILKMVQVTVTFGKMLIVMIEIVIDIPCHFYTNYH